MNNFMSKLKYRIDVFMTGRNGSDRFALFLLWCSVAVFFINIIFRSAILGATELLILGYAFFRICSRNISARRREEMKYFTIRNKITGFIKLRREIIKCRKTHVFRKCPKCKAMLRFPKKKGEHTATCPACGEKFDLHI